MLRSAKIAPVFDYDVLERFWGDADDLGYHAVWNYDHFYGLVDPDVQTFEGWTSLAAMAKVVTRARVGCMVTGVTYRHPALLAKMAVTVDHVSGGRLELGMGAAWHEGEHRGYGFGFPSAATRIDMLDEACTMIRRLLTEDRVTFEGRFWTLTDAVCNPKPVQGRVPIVIGGAGEKKTLRVVARHADEWNVPDMGFDGTRLGPDGYRRLSAILDEHCSAVGRDPSEIRRSVQLFLVPDDQERMRGLPGEIDGWADAGVEHVVLSFYKPPSRAQLEALAPA